MTVNNKPDILILEDSPTLVQRYMGMLETYNCEIKVANTVKEALDIMVNEEFDLYIIDLLLNDNTEGSDVIGKAGADPKKCIIVSGTLTEDSINDLTSIHRVPRDQIMNKPPDIHRFIEILNTKILTQPKADKKEENQVSSNKTETIDSVSEFHDKVILPYIKQILKNLSLKQWIVFIVFLISLPTTITTYATYRGWHEKVRFDKIIETECEERFKNYRSGDTVSSRTYIEETRVLDTVEFITRVYPDNFTSVLITSTNDKFEPRKFWLVGPEYAKQKGLDKDKTLLDIIKDIIGV